MSIWLLLRGFIGDMIDFGGLFVRRYFPRHSSLCTYNVHVVVVEENFIPRDQWVNAEISASICAPVVVPAPGLKTNQDFQGRSSRLSDSV
jgi:hypothetical protein